MPLQKLWPNFAQKYNILIKCARTLFQKNIKKHIMVSSCIFIQHRITKIAQKTHLRELEPTHNLK